MRQAAEVERRIKAWVAAGLAQGALSANIAPTAD